MVFRGPLYLIQEKRRKARSGVVACAAPTEGALREDSRISAIVVV